MEFKNVELLLETSLVFEGDASWYDYTEVYGIVEAALADCIKYIKSKKNVCCCYACCLHVGNIIKMYSGTSLITNPVLIKTPFSIIDGDTWNMLREDKDNPIFKVINYVSENIRGMRYLLQMHGVDDSVKITPKLLEEEGIVDYLGLYKDEFNFDFKKLELQMKEQKL